MSMTSEKIEEMKAKFLALSQEQSYDEVIESDSLLLMASYLSEFERVQKERNIKRNELASQIKISPSYLTQVFRGDKPLNFPTISKLRKALNIRFEVVAKPIKEATFYVTDPVITNPAQVITGNFTQKKGQAPFTIKIGALLNSQDKAV
jgi:transcriptional regulator with XRE-family HTH domain